MHRARVIVPAKIAAALHGDPNLAGPAIEAFYNRDVDDMSAAAHMSHFAPQVITGQRPHLLSEATSAVSQSLWLHGYISIGSYAGEGASSP